MVEKGFEPDRANIGVVRVVASADKKAELVAHSRLMRAGLTKHYAPLLVDDDYQGNLFECAGGNHLNGTVGNFKAALRAYNGFDFVVPEEDELLQLQVKEGLLFSSLKKILPTTILSS